MQVKLQNCPLPAGWCLTYDEAGSATYAHKHGAYPPQCAHPVHGYLYSIARVILSAEAAGASLSQLACEIQRARARVSSDSAKVSAAWRGPVLSSSGVPEWICEQKGWYTDVDPAAAPNYLTGILNQLEDLLFSSQENGVSAVSDVGLLQKTLTASIFADQRVESRLSLADISGGKEVVASTPSKVTPATRRRCCGAYSSASSATNGPPSALSTATPATRRHGILSGTASSTSTSDLMASSTITPAGRRSCIASSTSASVSSRVVSSVECFNIASPASWYTPASARSLCSSLDLQPHTRGRSLARRSVHFSIASPADQELPAAQDVRLTPPLYRRCSAPSGPVLCNRVLDGPKQLSLPGTPDLEAAYGCDWVAPVLHRAEVVYAGGDEEVAGGVVDNDDELRPQRLDFDCGLTPPLLTRSCQDVIAPAVLPNVSTREIGPEHEALHQQLERLDGWESSASSSFLGSGCKHGGGPDYAGEQQSEMLTPASFAVGQLTHGTGGYQDCVRVHARQLFRAALDVRLQKRAASVGSGLQSSGPQQGASSFSASSTCSPEVEFLVGPGMRPTRPCRQCPSRGKSLPARGASRLRAAGFLVPMKG